MSSLSRAFLERFLIPGRRPSQPGGVAGGGAGFPGVLSPTTAAMKKAAAKRPGPPFFARFPSPVHSAQVSGLEAEGGGRQGRE